MKKLLSEYIAACINYWFNIAPFNGNSHCSVKRVCINTVKDFDVRFIQPASTELTAARIVGNMYLLQSILPPENTEHFEPLNRLCQSLINNAVNYLQHETVSTFA